MELKYWGENLTQEEIEEIITSRFRLTNHAIQRCEERANLLEHRLNGSIDFEKTRENIVNDIKTNLYLAYFNTDGSINIAVDKYNYYVFVKTENGFLLTTYKEQSWNNITINAKQELARKGIGGQYLTK